MSRNWLREWSVTVDGKQINPELRVRFHAELHSLQAPSILDLTVSNMAHEPALAMKNTVGKSIVLEAGYQENSGIIFGGQIKRVLANIRENQTDTAVAFYASGREQAYRYGHINKTLKAGSTGMDVYQALLKSLSTFGVVNGNIPEDALKKIKFPRAHVLYGDTTHHLRKLAQDVNAQHHYGQNGQLHVTPADYAGKGGPIKINSNTGMIGLPVDQEIGIIVTFLINPDVQIGSKVKINQADIQEAPPIILNDDFPDRDRRFVPRTSDGVYVVVGVTWDGDTRGNEWYGTAILNNPKHGQGQDRALAIGLSATPRSQTGGTTP